MSRQKWQRADNLVAAGYGTSASEHEDTEASADETFSAYPGSTTAQQQQLRGMNMNMNAYASQAGARQTPRLQNTQKTAVGAGGWGNFGSMGGAGVGNGGAGGAGGFGRAPGLGDVQQQQQHQQQQQQQQPRPTQLSGFAQVMGGGGQQGPIDMR